MALNAVRELAGDVRVMFFEPETEALRIFSGSAEETRVISAFGSAVIDAPDDISFTRVSVTNADGAFISDELLEALRTPADVVVVSLADAETGIIFPVKEIADAVEQSSDARLIIDISAAAGKIAVDKCAADTLLLSADGIAALIFPGEICGEPASANVGPQNLAAFERTMADAVRSLSEMPRLAGLRERIERSILENVPSSRLNTTADTAKRLPNISSISFENTNGEVIAAMLGESGFRVTSGSACAGPQHEPSAMLRSLNVPYSFAMGSVRIELSPEWNEKTADNFASETRRIVEICRSYG